MTAVVKLKSGDTFRAEGRAGDIAATINVARSQHNGDLVEVVIDAIPSGQRIWIDPNEVESIIPERHSHHF